MIFNKTIQGVTKQFDVMVKDLDVIMEDEAKNTEDLSERIQNLEHEMNMSLDTQKKALKIQKNIKELIS